MLVLVIGLPGSGKSYFASEFARLLNAVYINSDIERNKMLAVKTYTEKEKLAIYDLMLKKMSGQVKENNNVVLDATFYKAAIRNKFISEAQGKVPLYFIQVIANEALIKQRLKKQRQDSDADVEIYKKIQQQWEPLSEVHLTLESKEDNIREMLQKASDYMHIKNDKRTN